MDAETNNLRTTCVIFGARSSSFLLNVTIKHYIKKYKMSLALSTVDYVNNLINSLIDTDLAYAIHKQIKPTLGKGGFKM